MAQNSTYSLGSLPLVIDPTVRNIDDVKSAILNTIATLTPEWNDFSPTDPGVALVEALAAQIGGLHYALDRVQNEGNIATAQQKFSLSGLSSLVGYEVPPAHAASVEMTIVASTNVTLPPYTKFEARSANRTFSFENIEAVNLTTGSNTVLVYEGEKKEVSLGNSTGALRQKFSISDTYICQGEFTETAIQILVNDEEWTQVTDFLDSEPDSEHYTVVFKSADKAIVAFGDGQLGKIPPTGQEITAKYRKASGASANTIGTGSIKLSSQITGITSATNNERPNGGEDFSSADAIKDAVKIHRRVSDRAVTAADHSSIVLQHVGGVGSVYSEVITPFEMLVVVAAEGDNPVASGTWDKRLQVGSGLLGECGRALATRSSLPVFDVVSADSVDVNITMRVRKLGTFTSESVKYGVQNAVLAYLRSAQRVGQNLRISDLYRVVEDVDGVDSVLIDTFNKGLSVTWVSGGSADSVDAIQGTYTSHTRPETFTCRMTSTTQFYVDGSLSGTILNSMGTRQTFTLGETADICMYYSGPDQTVPPKKVLLKDFALFAISDAFEAGFVRKFTTGYITGDILLGSREIIEIDSANDVLGSSYVITVE